MKGASTMGSWSFLGMLKDWPLGTVIACSTVILGLMLLLLVVSMVFTATDSWRLPKKRGQGIVTGKKTISGATSMIPVNGIPIPVRVGPRWSVTVKVGDQCSTLSVTKAAYEKLRRNQKVDIDYCYGRYSRLLYVADIYYA